MFDSHAHLTGEQLWKDADAIVDRAQAAGVSHIVNICTDATSLERGLALGKRHPNVFNAAATTPHDVEAEGEALFATMAAAAHSGQLVAVGETGLDYFYEHSNREVQQDFLRRYLRLARECHLPIIIHCREAFQDLFKILDEEYRTAGGYALGVLHCFTGTWAEAQELVNRGFFISLSAIVTYKKSESLREVARQLPLNHLLIETDAPFLAPQSRRGKVNEPAFLSETCRVIASVRGVSSAEVAAATSANAQRLFVRSQSPRGLVD